ncbi:MAG: FecR family protein [Parcubacteria group bacterium]
MSLEPVMTIDDLAAAWFARQRAGDMTPAETAELDAWLDADPEHRAALDALHRAWERAELARHDPEILAWRERALKRPSGWRRWVTGRAVAAALMVAVLGAGATWGVTSTGLLTGYWRFSAQEFHTDHGQRATFTLPDGSKVTLNTDSQLRTRAADGKRLVYLDRGQAFFKVAHDASHPFVVHAAGRTITAIGTAFDVRVEGRKLEVTLVEGKIRVEAPTLAPTAPKTKPAEAPEPSLSVQATEMTAGSQLVALDPRGWTVRPADTARETSWLAGRLMFENQTLATVADEFSRYSEQKIVFDDPALADERITGTFRSGDVGTFVRALEKYRIARVESETDDAVRLTTY